MERKSKTTMGWWVNNIRKRLTHYYSSLSLSNKNLLDTVSHVPVLKKGDKLFPKSEKPDDAIFYRMRVVRPTLCIEGYFRSGIVLLNEIEKNSKSNLIKDSLLYPTLHTIHQYLELVMKDTISNYNNGAVYNREHNLQVIWNNYIEACSLNKKDEEIKIIGKLIQEFNSLSNKSMAFRYPYSDNAIDTPKYIHIKLLKERFFQLYRFFDGIHSLSLE